jgi:hypothetical protein
MRSKFFFILSIALMTFSFSCQKKSDSTYTNEINKEKSDKLESKVNPSGLLKSATDSLAERLMNDFGLVVLSSGQIGNIQFPGFSDYQSASNHITLMRQRLNQSISGSATMSSGPSIESMRTSQSEHLLPPGDCSSAGTYHSSLAGSGGFFSNFNVYFNTSSSGVSSASVYATGTPIGWSWSQQATSFSGSSYSGCVGGYITNGIQIGNITIGWQQAYHFNFNFSGSSCTLSYSQGSGPC